MDIIYSLMDTLLPFEWLDHIFMKNAFLAILMVTPLFGLLSTMVVSNRMAFFSDSLGHGAFTGIALGVLIGIASPMWALIGFSVIYALLITYINSKGTASKDTIIGVFSSTGIALGLLLMSYGGSFGKFQKYLIGDILSISPEELTGLLIAFVLVILAWVLIFNRLLVLSVNPSFARSRGINVFLTESAFAVLVAVVVAMSIQWVGLLIINSLLVLPAAAARNVTNNVKQYHFVSVAIAMFSGLLGLFLAYQLGMAAGAAIVVISAIAFFITLGLKHRFIK